MKNKINKAISFFKDAYFELKKVSWLGKKEVAATTVVVAILIFILAAYIGLVDFILSKIVGFILKGRV